MTAFVDSPSGDTVLQVASDADGSLFVAFHLYDQRGELVAESTGFEAFEGALKVKCSRGEVLLDVPKNVDSNISYRLYNAEGNLLTWSDGERTKIYPNLHMDGVGRGWAPE